MPTSSCKGVKRTKDNDRSALGRVSKVATVDKAGNCHWGNVLQAALHLMCLAVALKTSPFCFIGLSSRCGKAMVEPKVDDFVLRDIHGSILLFAIP